MCHTAGLAEATRPPLLRCNDSQNFRKFLRLMGTHDWNYPFSLCGSLYRVADVEEALTAMPAAGACARA